MSATESTRLAAAARLLSADLSFAQTESLAHADAPRGIRFDTSTSTYSVVSFADATPHDCDAAVVLTNPIGGQAYTVTYGTGRGAPFAGVTVNAVSLGGDACIAFEALGELDQATAATITLGAGARTLTLSIDPDSGEVTVP